MSELQSKVIAYMDGDHTALDGERYQREAVERISIYELGIISLGELIDGISLLSE